MPTSKGLLFVNPRSGTFSAADEVSFHARAHELGLRIVSVSAEVDVRKIVRESLDAGLRAFVVAGGDGSLHHVGQALVNTEGVLGVVPVGSVNHFARDLRIPIGDWRAALDLAVGGSVRQIDVGQVNGRYFFNSMMFGITPTISEYRERFRSTHNRWISYAKAIRLAMHHFPHTTLVVEFDGRVETFRTQLFVVAVNGYDLDQTGFIATKTTFEDGRLSIYSLSFMGRLEFIRAAAKYLRGKIADLPGFKRIRTRQLRVDTAKRHIRVALDGELHEFETPLRIASVPASLLVRS